MNEFAERAILVSVVMPCLNESRTLAACIERAHHGGQQAIAAAKLGPATDDDRVVGDDRAVGDAPVADYEIVIADNGSSDDSVAIASRAGARVVAVPRRGYGAALQAGIAAAAGRYVVMGDADCSYDFGDVPRFVQRLQQGDDLVMGNRFAGEIRPGAMPWLHRWVGNPLLSGLGRALYRTPCRDWHCGLRGFDRQRILDLQLVCPGMEYASEMVLAASRSGYRISEIPIVLHPDQRDRPPHLRSFRDGWRHLKLMVGRWPAQAS